MDSTSLCTVDGCDRPTRSGKCPYCHPHYERLRTTGNLGSGAIPRRRRRKSQATYFSAHHQVRLVKGPAADYVCPCGAPAKHWAYDHTDPNEVTDERGYPFSLDPDFYVALCVPCHYRLDNERQAV